MQIHANDLFQIIYHGGRIFHSPPPQANLWHAKIGEIWTPQEAQDTVYNLIGRETDRSIALISLSSSNLWNSNIAIFQGLPLFFIEVPGSACALKRHTPQKRWTPPLHSSPSELLPFLCSCWISGVFSSNSTGTTCPIIELQDQGKR